MSQTKPLAIVIGANGYLGTHVVDQLVSNGYRVRGTVRSVKLAANKESFAVYGDDVEIIAMDDLIKGQYPEAFKGVDALVFVAAPMVNTEPTSEAALTLAVEGSLNVLRQAEKAGIKNFSFTSSLFAYSLRMRNKLDFTKLTDDQFLPLTKDDIVNSKDADGFTVYAAGKSLSERAVWDWAEQNPHVEMATVNPSFFYGPFAPGHKSPFEGETFQRSSLSTMDSLWNLIKPKDLLPLMMFTDVRDVAKGLVTALKTPPTSKVGRKRFLMSAPAVQASELADLIRRERPQLADRLCVEAINKAPHMGSVTSNERLKEVLRWDIEPWKKTVLDGIDALIELEAHWEARGKPIYP